MGTLACPLAFEYWRFAILYMVSGLYRVWYLLLLGFYGLIVGFEDEIKVKHCLLLSVQEINIY
jgi:hypothetical protein